MPLGNRLSSATVSPRLHLLDNRSPLRHAWHRAPNVHQTGHFVPAASYRRRTGLDQKIRADVQLSFMFHYRYLWRYGRRWWQGDWKQTGNFLKSCALGTRWNSTLGSFQYFSEISEHCSPYLTALTPGEVTGAANNQ